MYPGYCLPVNSRCTMLGSGEALYMPFFTIGMPLDHQSPHEWGCKAYLY